MYDDGSDDDDEDGLTESQVQIRRGGAHRPQAQPIQQDDEAYSVRPLPAGRAALISRGRD